MAAAGGLLAFFAGRHLERLNGPINVLEAAGLSLFAVTGAMKATDPGAGPAQAIIVGGITAGGGGTIRDVLVLRVPSVLSSGRYAVRVLIGATGTVAAGSGLTVRSP